MALAEHQPALRQRSVAAVELYDRANDVTERYGIYDDVYVLRYDKRIPCGENDRLLIGHTPITEHRYAVRAFLSVQKIAAARLVMQLSGFHDEQTVNGVTVKVPLHEGVGFPSMPGYQGKLPTEMFDTFLLTADRNSHEITMAARDVQHGWRLMYRGNAAERGSIETGLPVNYADIAYTLGKTMLYAAQFSSRQPERLVK